MYLGKIVELAENKNLYENPLHPYTNILLDAIPVPDVTDKKKKAAPSIGDVPSPLSPPDGCHFHPRCPKAMEICKTEIPELIEKESGHFVRCFLFKK